MSLRELTEGYRGHFSKADKRVLEALLASPQEGTFLSAKDVARRAAVHPTSAVRLAQKLGFHGYRELRAKLQQDMVTQSKAVGNLRKQLVRVEQGSLRKVVDDEILALQALPKQVVQESLQRAAEILIRAGRICLFGYGYSEALALLMDMRLGRSGYATRIIRLPEPNLANDLSNLTSRDAVLIFTLTAIAPSVPTVIESAAKVGASTIVIADTFGPLVRPLPDILLCATPGSTGDTQTLAVPIAICDTLILLISALDKGKSFESIAKSGALRKRLRAEATGKQLRK